MLALISIASAQDATPQFPAALVEAAIERTTHQVRYDGRYISIDYPGGDVPADRARRGFDPARGLAS